MVRAAGGLGVYRSLILRADTRLVLLGVAGVGLGGAATPLAAVLLVAGRTGSLAAAGLASGGFALGLSVSAPLRGRLVDVRGARSVVPVFGTAHLACLAGLAVASHWRSAAAAIAFAFLAGMAAHTSA